MQLTRYQYNFHAGVRLCRVLPTPLNGAVNYGNREPGDVATYSCKDRYRLVGPERRICARDQDGEWSGMHPICESKKQLVSYGIYKGRECPAKVRGLGRGVWSGHMIPHENLEFFIPRSRDTF